MGPSTEPFITPYVTFINSYLLPGNFSHTAVYYPNKYITFYEIPFKSKYRFAEKYILGIICLLENLEWMDGNDEQRECAVL